MARNQRHTAFDIDGVVHWSCEHAWRISCLRNGFKSGILMDVAQYNAFTSQFLGNAVSPCP
eukprot:m.323735 g.323735  ORF g.323735 m.323735 type:complete len:61 (-) comp16006_c0_seq28:316-498(-)